MLDQLLLLLLRSTCRLLHFDMFGLLSGIHSTPTYYIPLPPPCPLGCYKNNFAYKLRQELRESMQLSLSQLLLCILLLLLLPFLRTLTSMRNDKARGRGSVCQARRVALCTNIKAKKQEENKKKMKN